MSQFCQFCLSLRKYCFLNPFPCFALLIASLLWLATPFILRLGNSPPIEYMAGSKVEPLVARAGETVYVTRIYNVYRVEPIKITRHMIKGDCRRHCDKIELPSTEVTNDIGSGLSGRRPLVIPKNAGPGVWVLKYSITWDNLIGKAISIALPDIELTIVE